MTLTKINSKGIKDGEIINADINASAAIAGAKIAPNFGSQNIVTTGSVGIGTTNPSRKLNVNAGTDNVVALFESTDAEAQVRIKDNDSSEGIIGVTAGAFAFENTTTGSLVKILADGNVGIGTTSPATLLHLKSSSPRIILEDTGTDARFRINADSSVGDAILDVDYNSDTSTPSLRFNMKSSEKMRLTSAGRLGIGTTAPGCAFEVRTSEANGIISRCTATQSTDSNKAFRARNNSATDTVAISYKGRIDAVTVNETSDIALKENIQPLSNTLEKIKQITGYSYNFKDSETNSVGVIAQDVEKVFPELVHGEEGTKKLQYSGLVGALIEAVKELSDKVTALEAA